MVAFSPYNSPLDPQSADGTANGGRWCGPVFLYNPYSFPNGPPVHTHHGFVSRNGTSNTIYFMTNDVPGICLAGTTGTL